MGKEKVLLKLYKHLIIRC